MNGVEYIPYGFYSFLDNLSNSGSTHSECKRQTFERFPCCEIPVTINNNITFVLAKAAQNKWKNLKDYFRRELKKLPVSRSGDPGDIADKSHWPYFKSLLFLQDQFLPRSSTSNLVESEDAQETSQQLQSEVDFDNEVDETETFASQANEDMDNESDTSVPTPSTSSTNVEPRTIIANRLRKRKTATDTLVSIEKQKLQILMEKRMQRNVPPEPDSPADDHQLFFNSLLPHVRKIQDASIMQFRNDVQNLVQRYAYGHRTLNSFSYSSNAGDGSSGANSVFFTGG